MRRVVITGMGVVSPLGTGTARFFDGLADARSGIRAVQAFDATSFPTRIAGEVPDLASEGISLPAELAPALRRDRKALFAMVAGREALHSAFAGRVPKQVAQRMGAFVATGLEIFHARDLAPHVKSGRLDPVALAAAAQAAPLAAHLEIPSDLAVRCLVRETGIAGPVAINVSACAAGTQAVGEALWALRDGVVDAALVGGYDSMVNPLGIGGFSLLGALSQSNDLGPSASRPFDKDRDGFVLGEGAAFFVFETWESARARQAAVLAEVLGYGSSLDAYRVSDPAPDQSGAVAAMRAALADARLAPETIDYVNAHGTGTRKNDPAETRAIREVFSAHADRLPVSSTKSQIGHLIGAAGAVEVAAAIFALTRQIVPATINLATPDPECDLDYVPGCPRHATVRRVLSNSFGFGGQNACIVLGDPELPPARSHHV
jgi:3-oxoacyl-(acyl-carrier-protein) synthase